jgi:xanthine dehydrogenase YagT iron-sulfur-binding subunit
LKGIALTAGAAAALPGEGVLGNALGAAQEKDAALGPGAVPIALSINGKKFQLKVEPRVTLLDALRNFTQVPSGEYVDLTGAKEVCDRSSCGACTVVMGGRAVYACSVLAIEAQGKEIQTVEGLEKDGKLHPVQEAFVSCDGLMCGFCTPGFVVAAKALLDEKPHATRDEIRRGLSGNLCRCGTQNRALEAVLLAAGRAEKKNGGR